MRRVITLSTIGLLGRSAPVWAQQTTDPATCGPWQMMQGWGMGWGWGHMGLGVMFMILWLILLIAVVVLLVRWVGGATPGSSSPHPTPRDILDERFARGEIEREEYESRRKALGS